MYTLGQKKMCIDIRSEFEKVIIGAKLKILAQIICSAYSNANQYVRSYFNKKYHFVHKHVKAYRPTPKTIKHDLKKVMFCYSAYTSAQITFTKLIMSDCQHIPCEQSLCVDIRV